MKLFRNAVVNNKCGIFVFIRVYFMSFQTNVNSEVGECKYFVCMFLCFIYSELSDFSSKKRKSICSTKGKRLTRFIKRRD